MMTSSLTFAPSFPRRADAPVARSAEPDATPRPIEMSDAVSFDGIDSAKAAAQLPLMDHAVLLNVIGGALLAASASKDGGVPRSAYVDVTVLIGSDAVEHAPGMDPSQTHSTFVIDPKNGASPLREGGIVGSHFSANVMNVDAQTKTATLRGTDEQLTIVPNAQGIRVDGSLGKVEMHLNLAEVASAEGNTWTFHAEGTLGGQTLVADTCVRQQPATDPSFGHITTSGKLGDAPIHKEYDIKRSKDGDETTYDTVGAGSNAGVPQKVSVHLRLGQGAATHQNAPAATPIVWGSSVTMAS